MNILLLNYFRRIMQLDNLIYISDKAKQTVTIVRVIYAGRDIENQL